MIVQIVNFPGMLLYYFIMTVCILPEIHGVCVVFGLPSQFLESGVDAIAFGRWLLVAEVPILMNGIILKRGSQIELFSKLRMKKRKCFQAKMIVVCAVSGIIWVFALAMGVIKITGIKTALQLIPMAASNILMWEAVQVMIYFLFKKAFWSGAVILLINGGSCTVGLYMKSIFRYMPAAWGMLCRSSLWQEPADEFMRYGYMIVANMIVSVICVIITIKIEGDEPYGCNSY